MIRAGEDIRVFVQYGGAVYDLTGVVENMSMKFGVDNYATTQLGIYSENVVKHSAVELSLVLLGTPEDFEDAAFLKKGSVSKQPETDAFWVCDFCKTVNPLDASYCGELHPHVTGCNSPKERSYRDE